MNYLLVMSIGPVQGMIASARRSRDLWSGSCLLSELSKSCATSLKNQGATLIFPHVQNDNDLTENSELSVGNKIQAVITAGNADDVKELVAQAKQATQARFDEEAQNALDKVSNLGDIRHEIWERQLKDYLEIQAVWVRIDDGYHKAVKKAGSALAARKATRDFVPSATNPYEPALRLPKSSLDGMRETVLHEDGKTWAVSNTTRRKLGLSQSEQLDCMGVVKRLGFAGKAEQFTPITRVMADSWIEQVKSDERFDKVKEIYKRLVIAELATRVSGNKGVYQAFAFDGQLLYRSRLETAIRDDDKVLPTTELKQLADALKPIWRDYGEPCPYGVLLLADGDKMGELLDKANGVEKHQDITKALSAFAQEVPNVMRRHRGHCIYAGGDDVLGFVPLDKAYDCAKELSEKFKKALADVANELQSDNPPTLSVGLAITHVLTPLGVMRDLAGVAEKHAKGDHEAVDKRRNALGLVLNVRGGSEIRLRLRWDDEFAHTALNDWIEMYKDKEIPSRIAYDTREIFMRTGKIASEDVVLNTNIQQAEFTRMLNQARTTDGTAISSVIINKLKQRAFGDEKNVGVGLSALADELIVARWLAIKTAKDLGRE
ncbi:MAG: type III-B CRISPR-associated protein Cas10/Cmr2 [Moraxella sp.]|nr:type III-B CRISPR-associated protein Cas10/Cmr2 [Moraxella sp.]